MQYQSIPSRSQLSLFEGFLAHHMAPFSALPQLKHNEPEPEGLSEMSLSGSNAHCRLLLAPILRDLSEAADSRWLTLIAPPTVLTQEWLKESGLNRERILLLQPSGTHNALDLACKALVSGCSHTVISWLGKLDGAARLKLRAAARKGGAQSLNIRLGQ